jgi:SAM-dependent methyltransferase
MTIEVAADWYQSFFGDEWLQLATQQFSPEVTSAQVDFILDKSGIQPGDRVLDLCCGHGRHSLELARRGYRVVGLDFNEPSLALARKSAAEQDLALEFIQADMRHIPYTAEFGLIVNLFTAFGYFEDQAQDQMVLDAAAAALKPGGGFLIDTINHAWLMRRFEPRGWRELPDGTLMFEKRQLDLLTGRNNVAWRFLHPDGRQGEVRHSLRVYTLVELVDMLEAAGLSFKAVWGSFEEDEYGLDVNRMIVLTVRDNTE